jgi:hypothetical protein
LMGARRSLYSTGVILGCGMAACAHAAPCDCSHILSEQDASVRRTQGASGHLFELCGWMHGFSKKVAHMALYSLCADPAVAMDGVKTRHRHEIARTGPCEGQAKARAPHPVSRRSLGARTRSIGTPRPCPMHVPGGPGTRETLKKETSYVY